MRKRHRHSLHHYIVREVGRHILAGTWAVGEVIPSDVKLCATLQVSRTALREALIVLAAKGLIEARQKIGTIVRPREEWNMLDADIVAWRVGSADSDAAIVELYELRKLIEPLAASLAATHSTRREIELIQKAYEDMAAAGDDGAKVLAPDMRFHRGIIAATGNTLFASLGLAISSALEVNFQAVADTPRGHAWALPLHKAIVDAIAAHNPKAARLSMHKLLEASELDLRAFLSNRSKRRRSAKAP
jgi:DNA-binding FadR family transcriptional regulator